jgi:glutamate decarboxylase
MGRSADSLVGEHHRKRPAVDLDSLRRIFTYPEDEHSTLAKIDQEISRNIHGFLQTSIVSGELPPATLEKNFSATVIPEDPIFVSEQAEFLLKHVVAQSVHTASPHFIGHMTSALPYFMLSLSKLMVALNQNLVKIETSKAFTPLERQVVAMLHRLVYSADDSVYRKFTHHRAHSLGVFCSGGTVANVTALWVARNQLLGPRGDFRGVTRTGLVQAMKHYGYQGLAILVSRRGHYSLSKAADLLGLGKDEITVIDIDENNKVRVPALRHQLEACRAANIGVVSVVGVAGTTETGQVDPLDAMADLCAEFGCRFHVDAAWGGPTLFSDQYRHLLRGIERADSVCFDAHKQLYIPMGAAVALFRSPQSLNSIEHSANYIIREGSRDLGKHTLEGSRPGMAILVHSGLHVMGRRGYGLLIDQGIERARRFAAMIEAREDFELMSQPELNLLCYRYVPLEMRARLQDPATRQKVNDELNVINVDLQKAQRAGGKSFVSRTKLQPQKYDEQDIDVLRVVLANPLTTDEILGDILSEQVAIGQSLAGIKGRSKKSRMTKDLYSV